jgi:hypothetical protein
MDVDNWPGFAEELGRKITNDVVARWMPQYEAGKITLREFYLMINAVYDSTSGLAPRETSDLLANIEKELRDEARRRKAA